MKILIIAFYYPPEDSWAKMASLRPASWTKYWQSLGHQVYVLTDAKDFMKTDSNIYGVSYWPSRPRWGAIDSSTRSSKSLKLKIYSRLKKLFNNCLKIFKMGSLFQTSIFWISSAIKQAEILFEENPFDVVVSTYGPPANHIVAASLKQKTGCFWVADYRDLWYGNEFVVSESIFAFVEQRIENRCVAKADLMTTVSAGLAKNLKDRFSKKVVIIENGFDPDDWDDIPLHSWSDQKIRLMYSGQIYAGKQDPSPLLEGLLRLKNHHAELAQKMEVLFFGWNLDWLSQRIDAFGLQDIVNVNEPKLRKEILGLQRSVDILIFLDWNAPKVNGILTGKLFEYLFSGKPILGIGSTVESAAGELMASLGVGYLAGNSVEKITYFLISLLNGQSLEYNPQHDRIQQFTRQTLAHKMINQIEEHMTSP